MGGVGLAWVVVGAIFGAEAISKESASKAPGNCDAANGCTPTGLTLRANAQTAATVSTVGLVAGGQIPRKEGVSYFADPKVIWSALLWLIYLKSLVTYKFMGRASHRFAIGVIMSFAFLLLTFWITNLFSALHTP